MIEFFGIDGIVLICITIGIFLVMKLDNWSTKTLLAYRHYQIYNDDFRQKLVELDKKEGVTRYELNKLARVLMNKYGVSKSVPIFGFVVRLPLILFLYIIMFFFTPEGSSPFIILYGFLCLYAGMLFAQIMRAYKSREYAEKEGVNLKEYGKKL